MAWPSPYPPHRPTSSSSPYPPYHPSPATSQLSSLYPSLPPTSPANRTTPSLSRSTTYLASLGPSLARPPPPPALAPALQGHFSGGAPSDEPGMRGNGEGDRRHSTIGMGERGWTGPSPSFSSSGGRNSYASKPPVTGRPELPHKSASSPTPTISSSAASAIPTNGNTPSSGGGGRKLQKPRRSSPSHSPYPPSSPTTTFSPYAAPSPAFPSPYPHPPAPSRSPYPSYNPSSAPPTAHSSPTFPAPIPPLAPVQSAPPAAYPGGVQRVGSSGPYPAYTPPPPPPGARVASFSNANGGGNGDAEEEKTRIRREEEEALARIHLESLSLESTRLASLAARESALLNRTIEASTHDHLRSEALERERERQEEEAVRAAVEVSRREEEERQLRVRERERGAKGKGRAVEEGVQGREVEEDVWARREREALEMAMRLSMEESGRYEGGGGGGGGGRVETSAEAFRRLSRPSALEDHDGVAALTGERSPSPYPLFQHPASSPPSASTSAPLPPEPSSSMSTAADLPPPPAYEHPAHASELDEPDDVIVGPGRPLPPHPLSAQSTSSSASVAPPPPPPGAAPASFHPAAQRPYPVYSRSPSSAAAAPPPLQQQQQQQQHHHPLFSSSSAFTRDTYPPPLASSDVGSSAAAPSNVSAQAGSFASSAYESYQPFAHDGDRERAVERAGGGGGLASSPEEHDSGDAEDPFADEFSIQQQHASPSSSPPPKDLFASAMAARRASLRSPASTSPSSSASSPPPPSRRLPDLPIETLTTSSPRPSILVETDRPHSRGSSPATATPGGAGSAEETPVAEVRPSPPLSTPQADTSLLSPPPTTSSASTSSLSPSPSSAVSLSPSPSTTSFHSTPSHGGLVSVPSSSAAPFARQDVLDSDRWGFVDPERAAMHPPLEYEGDFPRAAQLSCTRTGEGGEDGEGDGKEMFRCFAVEAKGWQSLLVYLMWHGNSRLEAAPSDLQLDKSNRGLQASVSLDFFRSFSTHQPRVRITLTLLPLSQAAPLPPTANSPFSALPVDPPLFEEECPSIRLALPAPLTLPLPLSAIATALSHAHTASRQTLRVLTQGVIGGGGGVVPSSATSRLLSDRAMLARAIDLFRRLNGERVVSEEEGGRGGPEAEVSTLDRLKARLRRTKKARVIGGGGGIGGGAGGSGRPAGGPLPEGAMLITPFSLD